MPKSYNEVRDEYLRFKEQFPGDPTQLTDFAKQLDAAQGVQDRAEAYTDGWYKQANAGIDRGFRATGLPQVAGAVVGGIGSGFDSLVGTNIEPTVRRLGEDLPRMTAEALLTIPAAATGVGAPAAAATWANRARQVGKVLGYGGSTLSGYAQTDSPVGGAINAASMGLSNKLLLPAERGGVDVAGRAAGAIRDKLGIGGKEVINSALGSDLAADLTPELKKVVYSDSGLKNRLAVAGGIGAEAAAQTGLNELTRQASLSVGPNAVGPLDPERNPFTPENIAGNVVGLAPFAGQLGLGMRSASGFDARQAKPLADMIENRSKAVADSALRVEATRVQAESAAQPGFDLKTEIEKPRFSDRDTTTLRQSIITNLAAAKNAEREGRPLDAARNYANADDALTKYGGKPENFESVAQNTKEVDVQARTGLAMASPEHLSDFVKKVNGIIEFYHDNWVKLAEGEIGEGEVNTKRFDPNQTSHPNASNPLLIEQLQQLGTLPKITFNWLKETRLVTEADLGSTDPRFVNDVAAQKAANYILDKVPDAIKARDAMPPTEVRQSADVVERQRKQKQQLYDYRQALASFPPEIQDALLKVDHFHRTRRPMEFKTTDAGSPLQGQVFHSFYDWMDRVIEAAETYDPVQQTVRLDRGRVGRQKLKGQPTSVSVLWDKEFRPGYRILGGHEEGKPRYTVGGKRSSETNIEGMRKTDSNVGFDPADEEAFKADLAESGGTGLGGMRQVGKEPGFAAESSGADLSGEVQLSAEELAGTTDSQKATRSKYEASAEKLRPVLDKLQPDQAWNLLQPVIAAKRRTDDSFHRDNATTIIRALRDYVEDPGKEMSADGTALITAWNKNLADKGLKPVTGTPRSQLQKVMIAVLRGYQELPGVSKMDVGAGGREKVANQAETALGRARLLIERLTTPKAVEVAKGYKGPMMMAAVEDAVESAAVRLSDGTILLGKNHPQIVDGRGTRLGGGHAAIPPDKWATAEPGFWTKSGKFVTREEASAIATKSGQVKQEDLTTPGSLGAHDLKQMALDAGPLPPEDLLVNHPKPGAFSDDVMRTVSAAVDRHFGAKGYSGDMRAMVQAATMAIVRTMKDVPVDFYKVEGGKVAGLANMDMTPGRGQVGLGVTPIDMENSPHFVHRVLTALTHELAHIDDFVHFGGLKAPDAYSEERKRQLDNLRSMYSVLDEDQRKAVLVTLDESLAPPGYRTAVKENPVQLDRASKDVDEFSASVMTMVTKSLLFGESRGLKNALETLDYSPTEVQEYAQFQFRAIRDVLQAMQDTLADPKIRAEAAKASIATGDPFVLSKAFSAVTASAIEASRVRDGTKEVALARDMVKAMSQGASTIPQVETDATWYRRQKSTEETFGKMAKTGPYAMANAREAMEMASTALGISYDKSKKPGVWARWFYPFGQLMYAMERSGVNLAKPLFNLVNDTESAVHRRYTDIVSPFIKQRADGTRAWDDEHPLIKNQTPSVRRGINEVSRWQSENGHVPMFVEVQGELVADTAARPEWEKIRKSLSFEDQQTVIAASTAMDKVGQNMARHTLSVLDESMTLRTARLLQMLDKNLTHDQAFAQADGITKAYQGNQVGSLIGTRPEILKAVDGLLGGPSGLVEQFKQVQALLGARPGFRTEQLPHDWIVMYKNADGETKLTSAPSEKQAYYARDRVVAAGGQQVGEIVNRSDLRSKYQAFDDPDTLLQKFAQVEGTQWDKAVEAVRAGFGNEVAEEVRGSYTPGAASLKDVGSQGFAKFLKGSESQIDRGSFDYLDAMLARAARLSASASYKTHGAMKDLILNDPRARMFPSLSNMVNEHWDNMLAPTSDLTKKVKALATGYFLGANLSSAAIEGTQSIMTVIPSLIASNESGGPVKAYSQLVKSIVDAAQVSTTTDWQKVAKAAESKLAGDANARLSSDDTKALMYRRAVADGIIGHGVVQDLLFSRDQKTLQTAKFGQGDYGPVPITELAGNKLYLGAQLLTGLYAVTSKFNDKISFFAGLNQGIEKGLTGDELYNHARQFKTLSTFGGGKSNAPGWVAKVSNVHTRSAVGMVNTLQQYGYGMVAMYAQFAKDSIDSAKSLTPQQRGQARKAFGTMLATQVAVGGALGIPFAGASLTLIEKLFGVPANQIVREGLASLGSDEDEGGVIAETALNGLGNQMFGLDLSSRVGVSNLLGTSSYRGFSVQDMLGPVPGMVSQAVQGLNWFGQNEPVKAAHSLVPAAFKNIVSMADSHAKYGDYAIRDGKENLVYNPSAGQTVARALGFRSREESQKRAASQMLSGVDQRQDDATARQQNDLARRLLQGDVQAPRLYAQEVAQQSPGTNASDVLRTVMERAVRMTQERDLLAGGSRGAQAERQKVMATFGSDVNTRQSEQGLMQVRMQLAQRLGAPELMPSGKAMTRAAVVDRIVQEKGVTRQQATALAEMMGL